MACVVAGIKGGGFGISAMGGLAGGMGGIANVAASVSSVVASVPGASALASSVGSLAGAAGPFSSVAAIVSGGANPLAMVTSGIGGGGFLNSIGSITSLGAGALTGALGGGFESIGGINFADGLANHAGELFGANPLQAIQSMAGAEAFSAMSLDIAGPLANGLTGQFGGAISSLTQALPLDGNFGNFLGSAIPDMTAMVTNGLTNFMPNGAIPGFSGDMLNLGSAFDMGDMANFGNPGQLVGNLLNQGAGGITGITNALSEVGLDTSIISNLSSSEYNDVLGDAMSMITNPEMIANAQAMLGTSIPGLSSMADFMDLSKVMPTSFASIIPDTMEQFRGEIQGIDLGSITKPSQFGGLVNNLQAVDFDVIKNITDVVDPDAAAIIASNFLGGTGVDNAVTVTDMMGSVGGIGIKAPSASYATAMNEMDALGAFDSFKTINSQLQTGIAGGYTTGSGAYLTDTIDDPAGVSHDDLDSFISAKRGQLESAVAAIASDTTWSGAFGSAKSSYTSMQNKILSEDIHMAKTDLHLEFRNTAPDNAYTFMTGLVDKVTDPANLALIQGMTEGEVDGKWKEYMQGATAEAQNINQMEVYGILPRSAKIAEI